MVELLSVGETLGAEETVLAIPDGRSVKALLNATPILSDEGAVESVVVTMQDMADVYTHADTNTRADDSAQRQQRRRVRRDAGPGRRVAGARGLQGRIAEEEIMEALRCLDKQGGF